MKVEIYIVLYYGMHIYTQFKNPLTNYTKSELLRKRLVLLPVDLDQNGLLLTKWFHMTTKIIGKS